MEAAVRVLRTIQIAMLVSIGLYVFVGERVASAKNAPDPALFYVLSLVSITVVGIILVVRRTLVLQSEETLKSRSADAANLGPLEIRIHSDVRTVRVAGAIWTHPRVYGF